MIDPATGDPVIVGPPTAIPDHVDDQRRRVSPGRVIAYMIVVPAGLLIGAFVAFIGLLFSGALQIC